MIEQLKNLLLEKYGVIKNDTDTMIVFEDIIECIKQIEKDKAVQLKTDMINAYKTGFDAATTILISANKTVQKEHFK